MAQTIDTRNNMNILVSPCLAEFIEDRILKEKDLIAQRTRDIETYKRRYMNRYHERIRQKHRELEYLKRIIEPFSHLHPIAVKEISDDVFLKYIKEIEQLHIELQTIISVLIIEHSDIIRMTDRLYEQAQGMERMIEATKTLPLT